MPRLKNLINDKERKTQCVMTDGTICYKIPLGPEGDNIGHFIESEKIDNCIVFRFASKKKTIQSLVKIVKSETEFSISFD